MFRYIPSLTLDVTRFTQSNRESKFQT